MLKQLCLLLGLVAGLLLWSCGTGPIAPPPSDQAEGTSGNGGCTVTSDNGLDNDTALSSGGDTDTGDTDTGSDSDVILGTDSAAMDSETGTGGDTASDTSSDSTVDTAVDSATSTASDTSSDSTSDTKIRAALWVANSLEGTVSKVDTRAFNETARYRTCPRIRNTVTVTLPARRLTCTGMRW